MILTEAQKQIAADTHRYRVVNCGRRFGKTTLAILEMLGQAVAEKDRSVAYLATTYQQARDIAWQELRRRAEPITTNTNESRLELEVKTQDGGKSRIILRGWESVDTLRGMRFDFIVLDEVASYRNFWVGWHEVLRPTLTDTAGDALFISTPKGFNHFYDLYNLENDIKKGAEYKSFHFSSFDNPHIKQDELEKARSEMTEDRFAQEYMADFRKTEGLVYKEFSRDRHLIDDKTPRPEFTRNIAAVDFGYTNPACILEIKEDKDGNYWVLSEWYKRQQTTEQIVQATQILLPHEVYPDPAEPDRIQEMLKAELNVREVSKDIANGINRVRELFKQGRIKIHNGCENLIMELETYRYPDKKPNKNEPEIPVKENDHALDALRYALYTVTPQEPADDFENFQADTDW